MRVLLCVTGGIAAYKAPQLVRELVAAGHEVRVARTQAAAEFVADLALQTVSGAPVRSTVVDAAQEGSVGHIELADWAQLVVVAPATANTLARYAQGLADDLVSTLLLATRAPVLVCPAMNVNMWAHAATQANMATLRARRVEVLGPEDGELACGWTGAGRMSQPTQIVTRVQELARAQEQALAQEPQLARRADVSDAGSGAVLPVPGPLSGRAVVVSAGPTRTYLDPVRFITNGSTGVMGFAFAQAAAELGARVTLVAGPVALATPPGVAGRVDVDTAAQLREALRVALQADDAHALVMSAAVSDLELPERTDKLEKQALLDALRTAPWSKAPDVLAGLTAEFGARVWSLGFAAQTLDAAALQAAVAEGCASDVDVAAQQALAQLGQAKRVAKGCDAVFANRVGVAGEGFASARNRGVLCFDDADAATPWLDKLALARHVWWLLLQRGWGAPRGASGAPRGGHA